MSKNKFLIVDDEETVREIILDFLELKGVKRKRVELAIDGKDASRKFQPEDFALVITDLFMPNQNGLDLIEHIKATGYTGKIILMSGASPPKLDPGIFFIQKPFKLEELWCAITKCT